MIKVAVSGACGRMGRMIIGKVIEQEDMNLSGALEIGGHPCLGREVSEVIGAGPEGVKICRDIGDMPGGWDVLVEFSSPDATVSHLSRLAEEGKRVVIGTTGLEPDQLKKVEDCAARIPVLYSPNMSIGVNLLYKLAAAAAGVLKGFDVEVVEMHHRRKKDAPSGTAEKIVSVITESSGSAPGAPVHGRRGLEERKTGEIGVHSVRGGTVTGEHSVIFAGDGERLEITHRAESREIFVTGTIKAIRFIAGAGPGLYSMSDVIG